ncbi:DNA mismatch repair protein MutL, partial [Pseudoflavonifractor phocaeensis]|nr:DNA mismatch repair protein MutL [Pseudoflavonifractor phocaeensis]
TLSELAQTLLTAGRADPGSARDELMHTMACKAAIKGDKLLLIDKHAAHERMHFDRLKAADYQPMTQRLLTPEVVTPPAEEGAALLEHTDLLARFGFGVEDFGGGALLVRECPDYLESGDLGATLSELAQTLLTAGRADPGSARDELMHTMACKAAIKG